MKATFTFLLLALLSIGVAAQYTSLPITFETAEEDTAWEVFCQGTNGSLALADNPANDGINTSAKCIKLVADTDADPWAGFYSDYYPVLPITDAQYMLQFLVYKDITSRLCFKLEQPDDGSGSQFECFNDGNTLTNEWELITFDASAAIGLNFNRITLFPDFPSSRDGVGSTNYVDLVGYEGSSAVRKYNNELLSIYPNPATEYLIVHYPGMTALTVSNVIGQKVMELTFDEIAQKTIYVNNLKNGVYFITIETSEGSFSTKFIKK